VEWAQKHIGSRFSNFCFTHADIYNKHYNPRGRLSPDAFRFPFEDASFDFVFLKSVFTHMLPSSIQHYLTEIRRVLKPNGHCLSTQFLLNEQSLALITQGRSSLAMKPYSDGCYVVDPEFPETAVGIFESSFLEWCRAASLKVSPPIHYGSWSGRVDYTSYQDIVVSTPEAATELN
jgi:SAM-dependent methyltransferase